MTDLTPIWYVIYRVSDGAVVRSGQMPRAGFEDYPTAGIPAGHALLEVDRAADIQAGEWVVGGELITPTTLAPAVSSYTFNADGAATVTISGVPNPSRVSVHHSSPNIADPTPDTVVTDGSVVLRTTLPGKISVKIVASGKRTWLGEFNAV